MIHRAYAVAFRRRWGIETSYRQFGDFLFAVSPCNLWALANVLLSTRIFRTFVLSIDYG